MIFQANSCATTPRNFVTDIFSWTFRSELHFFVCKLDFSEGISSVSVLKSIQKIQIRTQVLWAVHYTREKHFNGTTLLWCTRNKHCTRCFCDDRSNTTRVTCTKLSWEGNAMQSCSHMIITKALEPMFPTEKFSHSKTTFDWVILTEKFWIFLTANPL